MDSQGREHEVDRLWVVCVGTERVRVGWVEGRVGRAYMARQSLL